MASKRSTCEELEQGYVAVALAHACARLLLAISQDVKCKIYHVATCITTPLEGALAECNHKERPGGYIAPSYYIARGDSDIGTDRSSMYRLNRLQ